MALDLDRILKGGRFLPARAAETLAVPMLAVTVYIQLRHRAASRADPVYWTVSRMAAAALLGIVGAVYGAWVLLVEIVR